MTAHSPPIARQMALKNADNGNNSSTPHSKVSERAKSKRMTLLNCVVVSPMLSRLSRAVAA